MLVTLSGIVTLVKPLQPENSLRPMLVTGQPPSVEGISIAPDVEVGTAGELDDPPPSAALPPETVYVHVIPFTVAV